MLYDIYKILDSTNKNIVIVGSGDGAFDWALNLAKKNKITILNKNSYVKCIPVLWERSIKNRNITYVENAGILEIKSIDEKLLLICNVSNKIKEISADNILVSIGRKPQQDFSSKNLENNFKSLQKKGILYKVGDVKNKNLRQLSISVGDGVKAAMEIYERLKNENTG